MSSNQGNSGSGTLRLAGRRQGKRTALRLVSLRVPFFVLLLLFCMPPGTAVSQTNPNEILRFGTELLRVLNEQLPQDSGPPQETTPLQPEKTAPEVRPQKPQRPPKGNAVAASRISRAQLAEAQDLLNRIGFDAGPVDGMSAPRTRRAIQAYQRASDLAPTGVPDEKVLAALWADAAAIAGSRPQGSGHAAAGAGNEELMAEPPAASVAAPDPLLGLWSGEFVCAGSTLRVKVAMVDAFGGRHALVQVLDEALPPGHRHRTRNRIYAVPNAAPGESVELQWLGGFTGRHRFTLHPATGTGRLVADHEGCKEMEFARMQFPQQGAGPNALMGTWTGRFEACRQGVLSAQLDVIGTFPGEYLMDAEYVEEASAGRGRGNRGVGRKLFLGIGESGGGPVSFAEIARLRTDRKGEPIGYGSAITQIELEYDATHEALYGRTDRCEYGEFAKAGSQQEMMVSVTAPAAQPTADLAGEWEGYARCAGSANIPVTLQLETSSTGQIKGLIEYAHSDAITQGVVRQSVLGHPADNGESYDFVVERTLPGGRGSAPAGFTLRPGRSGAGIVADYNGATCSSLELARVTQQSTSRRPTVAPPADGGAFFASRQPREKCEAVAAWLAKVKSEYPGLDIMRTVLDQVYPKVAVLFADDDFIPVFGTPFDQMTDEQRKEFLRQFGALCKRDPFLRERVQGFTVVERAFLQTLDRPTTSFGLQAIHALIREARRLRTAIRTTLSDLPPEVGLDQGVQTLTPLKRKIENGAEYLWPSERQAALEEIRARLGASALAAAEADLERIAAMEEPSERLKALTAVHAGRNAYSQHLSPAVQSDLQGRVLDEQRRIADGQIGPMLASLEAASVEETALVQISALERQIEPMLGLLVPDLAGAYRQRIGRKRQDTFEVLVQAKLAELDTYEPGKPGLSQSAAWPARFTTLFKGFEEAALYEQAMQEFRDAREALLQESLPAFELELQRIAREGSGADIDDLLGEYLSWEGDAGFPISLMYEMVAQARGEATGAPREANELRDELQPERRPNTSAAQPNDGAARVGPDGLAEAARAATLAYDAGNHLRARELFDQTCEGGDAESCFRLGVMVFRGEGGEQDKAQARGLFDRACEGGDSRACSALR